MSFQSRGRCRSLSNETLIHLLCRLVPECAVLCAVAGGAVSVVEAALGLGRLSSLLLAEVLLV